MSKPPEDPHPPRHKGGPSGARPRLWMVLVAAALLGAPVGALFLWEAHGPPAATCSTPPPPAGEPSSQSWVIQACGSHTPLGPHAYAGFALARFSDAETVLGRFTATVPVGAYLLNSTEFLALPSNVTAPPPAYFWSSGTTKDANLTIKVPGSPAQHFLLVENVQNVSVSVTWSQTLLMYYVPTSSYLD